MSNLYDDYGNLTPRQRYLLKEQEKRLAEEERSFIKEHAEKVQKEKAIFNLGVEVGIKLMMNKIQRNCDLGRPVMANGELYWLTDSREHLIEVMDSLELHG